MDGGAIFLGCFLLAIAGLVYLFRERLIADAASEVRFERTGARNDPVLERDVDRAWAALWACIGGFAVVGFGFIVWGAL
jgi:hypothetical protein